MFIVRSTLVFIVVTIVIATENFNCLVRNPAHGSNNEIRMVRIAVIKQNLRYNIHFNPQFCGRIFCEDCAVQRRVFETNLRTTVAEMKISAQSPHDSCNTCARAEELYYNIRPWMVELGTIYVRGTATCEEFLRTAIYFSALR